MVNFHLFSEFFKKLTQFTFVCVLGLGFQSAYAEEITLEGAFADFHNQNYGLAFAKFKKMADQNQPLAQSMIGYMLLNGMGVEQNGKEGVKWYKKAANNDDYFAHSELGRLYWSGKSVPQDHNRAGKHFKACSDLAGDRDQNGYCHNSTGFAYMNNWIGNNDDETAKKYFKKGFQLGNQDGFLFMSLLADGEGKDVSSLMWMNICAAYSDGCKEAKMEAFSKASQAQIRKAQRMSSECVDSNFIDCNW